ncbi:MAG: L,D-transpeptidase family protein [SAR324 cluster bacterium]|nr:L,D-transpeptidase family protein [SAR324 cluster bacterium]
MNILSSSGKLLIFLAVLFLSIFTLHAGELRPSGLIFNDYHGSTVVVVDKSACRLMVYKFQESWKMDQVFPCTTGKVEGDKFREGDFKTPIGIYWLNQAWAGWELAQYYGNEANVYGTGAFEVSYPNYYDQVVERKDGNGIWIHGTIKGNPIPTRGCVSVSNNNFLELTRSVELGDTPVIIEEKVTFSPSEEIDREQQILLGTIESWRRAWEDDVAENYLSYYSDNFLTEKWNASTWREHKINVNSQNERRRILINDLSVLKSKNIYHIRFVQTYTSSTLNDVGFKHLFLVKEQDGLKIVSENWTPLKQFSASPAFQYAYKEAAQNSM